MSIKRAVWLTAGFVGYITILGVWGILTPDRKLSDFENRALAQLPTFTWTKLWDGRLTEQWERYLVDQFAGRDHWVAMKSNLEQASGKQENHDVFFGREGFLFERIKPASEQFNRNMTELREFADTRAATGQRLFSLFIPRSQTVYKEWMPPYANAVSDDAEQIIENANEALEGNVISVPVTEALLQHKEQSVYYRTDHHWTTQGAYWGYRQFADAAGIEPILPDQLTTDTVSDAFYGTYYTMANDRDIPPDTLKVIQPINMPEYEVCTSDSTECTTSIYVQSALQERDQYKLFFNGNPAWVTIESNAGTGRSIAVIKDSYANTMMPYLIPHYDQIYMIDMRYFRQNVNQYLDERKVDDILFLYGVTTLTEDDIFKWLNLKS